MTGSGNWFFKRDRAIKETIERWNDYLEIRLNRAVDETNQVAITLKNGKTYIGFITKTFDPSFERKYIVILPIKSGYRDTETHELYLTTDYTTVYLQLIAADNSRVLTPPEDFEIVIPVGEILSANFFDWDAYELFNPAEEELPEVNEAELGEGVENTKIESKSNVARVDIDH